MISKFAARQWRALATAVVVVLGVWAANGQAAHARIIGPPQILVTHDLGGPVEDRMRRVERMRLRGEGVAIPYGRCISACTLYLALPDTCVGQNAEFGFHGPSAATKGIGLPLEEFYRISAAMADHYPAPLREWFLSTARYSTLTYHKVSGAQLIKLGVKECT